MKRLITLILSLLMLVSLAACGSKNDEPKYVEVDLQNFFQTQYDALYPADADGYPTGPMVDNVAAMPEMLEGYYPGLSAIETKQCIVMMPMMSAVAYEVALIELTDAANAEAVKTILQTRINTQAEGGAWYPETVEGWKNNSHIVEYGPYVMMVVSSDAQSYIDAFNALFA